jgi:hypothetical protein
MGKSQHSYFRYGARRAWPLPMLVRVPPGEFMRACNIKPGFFKNEVLGTAVPILSLLFSGLWGLADREGRLEDRPLRIKAEIFPLP